jgi:casein kinase II subunit beta
MSTSSGVPESWISSFCSLLGHEYFAEVSEEFIEDDFNLTGLQSQVAMYKEALEVCLSCRRVDVCSFNQGFKVANVAPLFHR